MKNKLLSRLRKTLTFVFLWVFPFLIQAQKQQQSFGSKVRIGGGLGLSFGDGFFSGTLSPSAIYDFNEQFSAGFGLNGTYNEQKDLYTSSILGGSVLGLYNVIPQLQISFEFEELHVTGTYNNSLFLQNDNYWYPALFLGIGFRQHNFTLGLRYDVLYDANKSVYVNAYIPFVRVYF
jgi:long-subunit fatty acid transport protein